MASRTARVANLHCRMRPDELDQLDELARHFGEESRGQMIRAMIRAFRTKMIRDRQRGIGDDNPD